MDKLRKYIQECWGDIVYSDYDKVATLEDLEYNYRYIRFLLSTEAMFIKWLVDNDKIDLEKLDKKSERKPMYSFEEEWKIWFKLFGVYDSLLMQLAIKDNPIEFLISIYK